MPRPKVICDSAFEQILARNVLLAFLERPDVLPPPTLGELGVVLIVLLVLFLLGCMGFSPCLCRRARRHRRSGFMGAGDGNPFASCRLLGAPFGRDLSFGLRSSTVSTPVRETGAVLHGQGGWPLSPINIELSTLSASVPNLPNLSFSQAPQSPQSPAPALAALPLLTSISPPPLTTL